eukprot:scaffold94638_cov40-Prasinocladus_malaysianus.AAC.2
MPCADSAVLQTTIIILGPRRKRSAARRYTNVPYTDSARPPADRNAMESILSKRSGARTSAPDQ